MKFIVENWLTIMVVIIAAIVYTEGQLKKVKKWLLQATAFAEREFGSGTGDLKLSHVYDMFVSKFPVVSTVITFAKFSKIVDSVLVELNALLESNDYVKNYVDGENK